MPPARAPPAGPGGGGGAAAAAVQHALEHVAHLDRVGVAERIDAEDLPAIASDGDVPTVGDQPVDLRDDLGLGAHGDGVDLRQHRHAKLFAGADRLAAGAAARSLRLPRARGLGAVLSRALRAAARRPSGSARLEEVLDDAGDLRRIGVPQREGARLDVHVGRLVERIDQHLHALGEPDVALQQDLVRVRVDPHRRVVGKEVGELLADRVGLRELHAEDLADDRAVLGEVHDVRVGTEDDAWILDLVELGQRVDDDLALRLHDADVVQAERLEEQVEGLVARDRLVVEQRDARRGHLHEARHHDLAGALDDEADRVGERDVLEPQRDLVVGGGAPTRDDPAACRLVGLLEVAHPRRVGIVGGLEAAGRRRARGRGGLRRVRRGIRFRRLLRRARRLVRGWGRRR
ncbi:MAG: hypothetical protein U0575_01340 [Phycisphaerales bacterium]